MAADAKLQEGVRYGDSNLVESCLEDGADPNAIGLYGWSAIHEAASNGDIEILELLLQFKGDPNSRDELEGCTPVHYAAREGHRDCLHALLKAGGHHDVENNRGSTALDDAVKECRHVLEKEKTKKYLNMTLDAARSTIAKLQSQAPKSGTESEGQRSESGMCNETDGPQEHFGQITPRAWNSTKLLEGKKSSGNESFSGSLQLSFEYNSKAETFKIRVWSLQNILLLPAEFFNLSRIYVKSHLLPDKKGLTKRKSDEIRVDDPTKMDNILVTLRRKGIKDSFKAMFLPSTFKFSKALEYQKVLKEEVESKTVHIAVCIRHRYSTRTIPIASVQLPMREAVRKLIKERHVLHSCINYSMPDNIHAYDPHDTVVISEGMYSNRTTSHPTLRTKSRQTLVVDEENARASSDINLKAIRCHSVESVPSMVVDIQTDPKETSLDDLLQVSVEDGKSQFFDASGQGLTTLDIHGPPSPPETPLPVLTEDGELTDVSIVSCQQHPDIITVDIDSIETINLDGEALAKNLYSTPDKTRHRHVKRGFANPHITIVDDNNDNSDDVPDLSVDKAVSKRLLVDNKDAVIDMDIGIHGEKTKPKEIRGHLFKKKTNHKKGIGDGWDNLGYVVDMRTGQRSLLGQFGWRSDDKGDGGLEMLEILSDDQADAVFGAKKGHQSSYTSSKAKAVLSSSSKVGSAGKVSTIRETVIDVGTSIVVAEVSERTSSFNVQDAITPSLGTKKKQVERISGGREKIQVSQVSGDSGSLLQPAQSPVPVICVECVDEIDRSVSPSNKSARSPHSPRQSRRVSPAMRVSPAGKKSADQDLSSPATHVLLTGLSTAHDKDATKSRAHITSSGCDQQSSSSTDVQYVTETDSHSPELRHKTGPSRDGERVLVGKSSKSSEVNSRGKSSRGRRKGQQSGADHPEIEMLALWKDEEWKRKFATPGFKLQMFQRTSQDPHPFTPLFKKYHGTDPMISTASNPIFVPDTPPEKVSNSVRGNKVKTLDSGSGSSKSSSMDDIESSNITIFNQSPI